MTLEEYLSSFENLVARNMKDIDCRSSVCSELERHSGTDEYSPVIQVVKRLHSSRNMSEALKSAKLDTLAFQTALYRMAWYDIESLKSDLTERNER